MRLSYRTNELQKFRERATKYIEQKTPKKSMGEFCEYMGITRKTLSKYKHRDIFWQSEIENIKITIKAYNDIMSICGFAFVMKCLKQSNTTGIIEDLDKAFEVFYGPKKTL